MARELPNSQNLEQSLLGSLMVYPSIMQSCMDQGLDYEEFYLPIHQKIYAAIQELQGTGKPIDLNNVIARLQDKTNSNKQAGATISFN